MIMLHASPAAKKKLQAALHAKAKAEAGYRFYVLYDKISREDILAHAYAQCRANKGAAGVDGQDFADIEAADASSLRRRSSGRSRSLLQKESAATRLLIDSA